MPSASIEQFVALQALARAIDAKDPATRAHSERVAGLAEALARIVGWDDARALALHDAALVHDVGKIGIDDAILRKASALTPQERLHIKAHAEISGRIVEGVLGPEQVEWIRTHHERCDGQGYPRGLAGSEIPLGGALLAIADAYDAMTVGRRYNAPRDAAEVLAECRAEAGRHFSHGAVAALEDWLLAGGGEAQPPGAPSTAASVHSPVQNPETASPTGRLGGLSAMAPQSLVSGHGPRRQP
jgi:HD-GYP domain-containing protein (c-di-GMP phosphodiesterase class II)